MFKRKPFRSGLRVICAEKNLSFFIAADRKLKTAIQSLQLIDRYTEEYLVGNPVIAGFCSDAPFSLAVFIFLKIYVFTQVQCNLFTKVAEHLTSNPHQGIY